MENDVSKSRSFARVQIGKLRWGWSRRAARPSIMLARSNVSTSATISDTCAHRVVSERDLMHGDEDDEFALSDAEALGAVSADSRVPTLETVLLNLSLDKPIFPFRGEMSAVTARGDSKRHSLTLPWIEGAFRWEPTNASNLVIDVGSSDTKPIILYASRGKLIEKLTTVLDYKLMDDLLLTVEMVMEPLDFAQMMLSRLAQAFGAVDGWNDAEETNRDVVKMRGLIVLQHWAQLDPFDTMDETVRRTVVTELDRLWQHSPTLSSSDRKFIVKVRRLFDPHGDVSFGREAESPESGDPGGHVPYSLEEVSSIYDNESVDMNLDNPRKWREKLKLKLRAIFSRSAHGAGGDAALGSCNSSSLLMNSFSSEMECEETPSVLMTERSRMLAAILAVLESDIFHAITRTEIVSFPAARDSPQTLAAKCPNLQRSIEHFNSMCRWFVQMLVSGAEGGAQVNLLAKVIRLGVKCVLLHNYNSALQIILALQSPAVANRADLWARLPSWERHLARDLAVFGSPGRNFKNVRRALEEVGGEAVPAVPFTGLYLSDLVFNWERPDDAFRSETVISVSSGGGRNERGGTKLSDNARLDASCSLVRLAPTIIPFYKNHVAAKIVRSFRMFKHPQHRFEQTLSARERQLYSYFADVGRLGGEFVDNY